MTFLPIKKYVLRFVSQEIFVTLQAEYAEMRVLGQWFDKIYIIYNIIKQKNNAYNSTISSQGPYGVGGQEQEPRFGQLSTAQGCMRLCLHYHTKEA